MGLLTHFRKKKVTDSESIVEHLGDLLNTKCEFGFWQKNFGLSSYTYGGDANNLMPIIAKEVKKNIESFDPRIEILNIIPSKDSSLFRLRFQVHCKIKGTVRSIYIGFDHYKDRYSVEAGS